MNKSAVIIPNIYLIILASLIFIPFPSLAQTQEQYEIQQIDAQAESFAYEKKAARDGLRNLTIFATGAEAWFGKFDRVNANIRKAKQSSGEYATFNPSQLENALQQLNNERSQILNLNGGATVGGKFYTSMAQLKADYSNNQERNNLYQRYTNASESLAGLYRQRDAVSSRLEEQEKNDLSWNKVKVQDLEADVSVLKNLAADSNLVCMVGFDQVIDGAPPYMTKKMLGTFVRDKYLDDLISIPGKKFNKQELKDQILNLLAQSYGIKEKIRNRIIPLKQQEIAELRRKIAEEENRSSDISGCWVLFISDHDYPVVNITKGSFDGIPGYVARVTNVGVMDYIRPNHVLFVVNRVNKSIFEGWEYATDANGNPTTVRLRLFLNQKGDRMDYRADDMLSMGRCY